MNEYKVGSVADLISQSKGIKFKSNKKRHKADDQKSSLWEPCEKSVDEPVPKSEKVKEKRKNTLNDDGRNVDSSGAGFKSEDSVNEKKRKNSDDAMTENNGRKKKKKSVGRDFQEEFQSRDEEEKMGIDLNFVPSDSEEEGSKREEKPGAGKPEISRERTYKDFTDRTVFVGNIPINYDKHKICKMFSKFGKIQSARIRCVPIADINMPKKVAAIKKQFNSKRNSLVAYVKYESEDSANAALEANGMVVDGHHLRVDLAEGSKENDKKKAVFVGGLPFDVEDDELWDFFQNCGKINSVRIVRDSRTSMGKGFGYVNFDSTAAVELALEMNGQELKKRPINVKRCVKARNKNKRNAFGRKASKEMTDQLLGKKGKKFKEGKKKEKKNQQFMGDFQGRKANVKEKKKKKKLSKAALRQRKLVKILGASKS